MIPLSARGIIPLKYIDVFQNYSYEFGCKARETASMITGILMGPETCQILGHVSHNLLYWKKTSKRIFVVWEEEINEKNSLHPGQTIYGQNSGSQWESMLS